MTLYYGFAIAAAFIGAYALIGLIFLIDSRDKTGVGRPDEQATAFLTAPEGRLGSPKTQGPTDSAPADTARGGTRPTGNSGRAAPTNPRVTVYAHSRPYDREDGAA